MPLDVAIGLAFFAAGAALAVLGVLHRRRALAAARTAPAEGSAYSLGAFGEIARGVVITGVVIGGGNTVLTFLAVGGGRVISNFGIAGFVCMLAGFVFWFAARTKYTIRRTSGELAGERPGDQK